MNLPDGCVEASTQASGVPLKIEDEDTINAIAVLLRSVLSASKQSR